MNSERKIFFQDHISTHSLKTLGLGVFCPDWRVICHHWNPICHDWIVICHDWNLVGDDWLEGSPFAKNAKETANTFFDPLHQHIHWKHWG